jgi:hypothetical protein
MQNFLNLGHFFSNSDGLYCAAVIVHQQIKVKNLQALGELPKDSFRSKTHLKTSSSTIREIIADNKHQTQRLDDVCNFSR